MHRAVFKWRWKRCGDERASTLRTGYSVVIDIPSESDQSASALHYVPIGTDAVFSPIPQLDVGASFMFGGAVAATGEDNQYGFTTIRMASLWLRLRV